MKYLIIMLFLSFSIVSTAQDTAIKNYNNAPKKFKRGIDKALINYMAIKDALVKEDLKEAKKKAAELEKTISTISINKLNKEQMAFFKAKSNLLISKSKYIRQDSTNIEQARKAFEQLTLAVYSLIKSFEANRVEVYLQYCPMAANNDGAYWLSDREIILNPYFGNRMLHCGNVEEVIE